MYLDTCYIAKFYLTEAGSLPVSELVRGAEKIHSCVWPLAEFYAVLHPRVRGGELSAANAVELTALFSERARVSM